MFEIDKNGFEYSQKDFEILPNSLFMSHLSHGNEIKHTADKELLWQK